MNLEGDTLEVGSSNLQLYISAIQGTEQLLEALQSVLWGAGHVSPGS